MARRAGFRPCRIVFTGVGKAADELECAVVLGVKAINVESAGELDAGRSHRTADGATARAWRCGSIPTSTRAATRTFPPGSSINKFGVPHRDARARLLPTIGGRPRAQAGGRARPRRARRSRRSIRCAAPPDRGRDCRRAPRDAACALEYVDSAAGSGFRTTAREVPSPAEYVAALVEEVRPPGSPIVIEPGRALVGPAGVLVARVVDIKPRGRVQ